MLKCILKIELLSDMCCGSGEGNGVQQDIASGYDDLGLPVIYGKRIKGLLKDKAEFLKVHHYSFVTSELINKVFGTASNQGILKVGNAYIENIESIRYELANLDIQKSGYINPKSIEAVFTSNRFSTQIDENGIAKDKSLRMIGTVPKGLTFYADLSLDIENIDTEEYQLLEKTCKLLRGIGLNRNRGLGEVRCGLSLSESKNEKTKFKLKDNAKVLDYVIDLDSAMISPNDYISGSAVQGWFINDLLNKKMITDMEVKDWLSKVIFSNAYPYKNNKRYLPMPFGLLNEKNNENKFYSTADGYETDNDKIYTKSKGFYNVSEHWIDKENVSGSVEFHFAKKTKDIFALASLSKGQSFGGSIYADSVYLKKMIELINQNNGILYLGASSTAQYAKAHIRIEESYERKNKETLRFDKEHWLILEFLSDVVLIDDKGRNLTNVEVLEHELKKRLGEDMLIESIYTNIINIGGYNSKWQLPKRRYTALAKGTQVIIKKSEFSNIKTIQTEGFMGLLQNEGYGEYRIRNNSKEKIYDLLHKQKINTNVKPDKSKYIIEKVAFNRAKMECHLAAVQAVTSYYDLNKMISASNSMRIIGAYKASIKNNRTFYDNFIHYIKTNFAGKNNEDIYRFADYAVKRFEQVLESDEEEKEIRKILCTKKNSMFKIFLESYIGYTKLHYREEG